jgi:DNA-binding CsgD family transcriptional regulator
MRRDSLKLFAVSRFSRWSSPSTRRRARVSSSSSRAAWCSPKIVKISDFYSAREQHSTGTYTESDRPLGVEHVLMLCLPAAQPPTAGSVRHVRMYFMRGPGPDFSERDRALLTLLRPHLQQAYRDAERRRYPVPRLTPWENELLHLVAAGHTNTQIARQLGISEGTVRPHLENIYQKLGVSSRTAAVTRAFPDHTVHDPPRAAWPADQPARRRSPHRPTPGSDRKRPKVPVFVTGRVTQRDPERPRETQNCPDFLCSDFRVTPSPGCLEK